MSVNPTIKLSRQTWVIVLGVVAVLAIAAMLYVKSSNKTIAKNQNSANHATCMSYNQSGIVGDSYAEALAACGDE